MQPLFSKGEIMFVNPDLPTEPDHYVLGECEDGRPEGILLRQLKEIGGQAIHHPLNRQYRDRSATYQQRIWGRVYSYGKISDGKSIHIEVVEELLKSESDIDHMNRLGWTALLEAVISVIRDRDRVRLCDGSSTSAPLLAKNPSFLPQVNLSPPIFLQRTHGGPYRGIRQNRLDVTFEERSRVCPRAIMWPAPNRR